MEVKGIIDSIKDTKSKKFKTVKIDGKSYGADTGMIESFKEGDEVKAEIVQEGNFHNITKIEKTAASKISVNPEEINVVAIDLVKQSMIEGNDLARVLSKERGMSFTTDQIIHIADQIRRTKLSLRSW